MSDKFERKQINRFQWRILIWTPILIGAIAFSIFNSTFYMPIEYARACGYASIGGAIAGIGLGLMFSRVFKIKDIDN